MADHRDRGGVLLPFNVIQQTGAGMSRNDYLMRLRRISRLETLEKAIEKKRYDEMTTGDHLAFIGAADHRLAELITGRLYDRVPRSVWKWVR